MHDTLDLTPPPATEWLPYPTLTRHSLLPSPSNAEKLLGIGNGTSFLTNERLLELMDPTNPEMPYVFTDFSRWGNTETDLV